MSILVQAGFGKAHKIDDVADNNYADGVIFGPRCENSKEKLIESINHYSSLGFDVYFDPQFYFSVIENASVDKFDDYKDYFKADLKPKNFRSIQQLSSFIVPCINFQNKLPVKSIFSPTCIVGSFEGDYCQTSLTMAQSAIDYLKEKKITKTMHSSFVLSEGAFDGSKESMDDFISNITDIEELDNIYLVINKDNDAYSQQLATERLKNILYLIYSLSNRNNINIICGYSDIIGLLNLAVGAKCIATGWHQSLRRFAKDRYHKKSGGNGKIRQRYTSIPLLNSILNSELNSIKELGLLSIVLSGSPFDKLIENDPMNSAWNNTGNAFYHHLFCLNKVASELLAIENINKRIELMHTKIKNAKTCYNELIRTGVPFDFPTGITHLVQWDDALTELKDMIN